MENYKKLAEEIIERKNKEYVGTKQYVLVEGKSKNNKEQVKTKKQKTDSQKNKKIEVLGNWIRSYCNSKQFE